MKAFFPLLALAGSLFLNLSALGGPYLASYWPLNNGDQKTFIARHRPEFTKSQIDSVVPLFLAMPMLNFMIGTE